MLDLRDLSAMLEERFDQHLAELGSDAPRHRVEFSRRITTCWALIYYRRHLVRLSPYLFLLEPHALKHGSHWRELDATIRHEAAHAAHYHETGETGHTDGFHRILERLGVRANGLCDLGPENTAFRYIYGCDHCGSIWPRRAPLRGNYSCGTCAPGLYSGAHKLTLRAQIDPWRLLAVAQDILEDTYREGLVAMRNRIIPEAVDSEACVASSSSGTRRPQAPASA